MLDCVDCAAVRFACVCGQRALYTHATEPNRQAGGDTPLLQKNGQAAVTDEVIAHMLCDMDEKIRSNAATNATKTSSNQPADKTSRIKDMHISGLLALNPGSIDKNNNKEVLPRPVRQKMLARIHTFPTTVDEAPAQEALATAASIGASSMQVLVMRA